MEDRLKSKPRGRRPTKRYHIVWGMGRGSVGSLPENGFQRDFTSSLNVHGLICSLKVRTASSSQFSPLLRASLSEDSWKRTWTCLWIPLHKAPGYQVISSSPRTPLPSHLGSRRTHGASTEARGHQESSHSLPVESMSCAEGLAQSKADPGPILGIAVY